MYCSYILNCIQLVDNSALWRFRQLGIKCKLVSVSLHSIYVNRRMYKSSQNLKNVIKISFSFFQLLHISPLDSLILSRTFWLLSTKSRDCMISHFWAMRTPEEKAIAFFNFFLFLTNLSSILQKTTRNTPKTTGSWLFLPNNSTGSWLFLYIFVRFILFSQEILHFLM